MSRQNSNAGTVPAVPADADLATFDALETDAADALANVQDPAEAELLLAKVATVAEAARLRKLAGDRVRRWAGLRLKCEARYGELLGEAKRGNPHKSNVTGGHIKRSDRKARERARKVAAAKAADPEAFAAYVDEDPKPSRAGLLGGAAKRPAAKAPPASAFKGPVPHDPAVFDWVRRRRRQGWDSKRIVAASKAGSDGWPGTGALSDGSLSAVYTAIVHVERLEAQRKVRRARGFKSPTTQLRELQRRPSSDELGAEFWRLRLRASELVYVLYSMRIEDYPLDHEADLLGLADLHESLTDLGQWWDRTISAVQGRLTDTDIQAKIATLRDPSGRTPEEVETANRIADRLQRKLDNRLEGSAGP